jgi:Protein of unknown function (DUF3037)
MGRGRGAGATVIELMGEKRQCEILLLRLVPHALRDDFMTVGVVVLEAEGKISAAGGEDGADHVARFADVRFTRDWKRVECFAPEIEVEIVERLEAGVRGRLREIRNRADLLRMLESEFGAVFDVGPVKALVAEDLAAEMRVLEEIYLAPTRAGVPAPHERRLGRMGIVTRMQDAFAEAGILEMLQRDLDMKEFTGENDPFRVDFGFRVGKALKMFQGLALNLSREPAVTLAYRYGRIQSGMRGRGEEALMTAIVSEEALRARGEVASGIAMLRANEVEVRSVGEMGEIAERVRREVRG